MSAYEKAVLERLGQVLPGMPETRKAWLLGLVEGIAGEPGRVGSHPAASPATDHAAARPGA